MYMPIRMVRSLRFQSRNRGSFNFKGLVIFADVTGYSCVSISYRESWLFKLIDKIAAEVKSMKFRSRNRENLLS